MNTKSPVLTCRQRGESVRLLQQGQCEEAPTGNPLCCFQRYSPATLGVPPGCGDDAGLNVAAYARACQGEKPRSFPSFWAVVHTYGSFTFAWPYTGKLPEHAVALLDHDVLLQCEDWSVRLNAIVTDSGRNYGGTQARPCDPYLVLSDIEHRKTRVRRLRTYGFVESFH